MFHEAIPPARLRLVRRDLAPRPDEPSRQEQQAGAFTSSLTLTFDDGRVLTGDEAMEFVRRHRT
jgi:hypothetical protein